MEYHENMMKTIVIDNFCFTITIEIYMHMYAYNSKTIAKAACKFSHKG